MSGFYVLAITEVLYFDLGRGSVLVDRPNTTPVGHGGASQ